MIGAEAMTARATITLPSARMNGTERRYAEYLDLLMRAGEAVERWDFDCEKLRLADTTFYSPDFRVIRGGLVEFHEVKGHWEDDARVKIKVAASIHPYVFRAVTDVRGKWRWETFTSGAGEFP